MRLVVNSDVVSLALAICFTTEYITWPSTSFSTVAKKVAVKSGSEKYQWNILKKMGIPEEEIPSFVEIWQTPEDISINENQIETTLVNTENSSYLIYIYFLSVLSYAFIIFTSMSFIKDN